MAAYIEGHHSEFEDYRPLLQKNPDQRNSKVDNFRRNRSVCIGGMSLTPRFLSVSTDALPLHERNGNTLLSSITTLFWRSA